MVLRQFFEIVFWLVATAFSQPVQQPPSSVPVDKPMLPAAGNREVSWGDIYETCLQKMADQTTPDPEFMQNCMGLSKKHPLQEEGELTAERVQEELRQHRSALGECYHQFAVEALKAGHVREGQIHAKLTVKPQGEVSQISWLKTSTLKSQALAACFEKYLTTLRFRPFAANQPVKVLLAWQASLPRKLDLLAEYPKIKGLPPIPLKVKWSVYRREMLGAKRCYDRLLSQRPRASGRVGVKVHVAVSGKVSAVDVVNSEIKDKEFLACLRKHIATWTFPPPRTRQSVELHYPYVFKKQ